MSGLVIIGFVLGLMLGSLILCLATRSLTRESFFTRSYCPKCKHILGWYDLFPVLSYLFLKGKCRYCHTKIPQEYVYVELLMGLLTAFIFWQSSNLILSSLNSETFSSFQNFIFSSFLIVAWQLLFKLFIVSILIIILITDLKTGLIPDRITYPAVVIAFLMLLIQVSFQSYALYYNLSSNPIGRYLLSPETDYFYRNVLTLAEPLTFGLLASLILTIFFGTIILVTKGRGMGGGDLKLGVFLGLVFGLPYSFLVLMLSFILGSIVGVGLLIFGKKRFGQTIPFGPFLTAAGLITLFWGQQIINWYLSLKLN